MAYHHGRKRRCKSLKLDPEDFRRNLARMDYERRRAQNLPTGLGAVEAACRTLVTQRMKRSRQRWTIDGRQAILTGRALAQSERFDGPWKLVSAECHRAVFFPESVVPNHAIRVPSICRDRNVARAAAKGPVAIPSVSRWASVRLPAFPRFHMPPMSSRTVGFPESGWRP